MSSEFVAFWKPFVRVFKFICVSHYSVFRPNIQGNYRKSLPYLIYFAVFATIHSSTVFAITTTTKPQRNGTDLGLGSHRKSHNGSPLINYVNALSVFGAFVTNLTIHLENIFGKREDEICERFETTAGIFELHLNYKVKYKLRLAKYLQTIGLFVFAMFLASITAFSKLPSLYNDKFFMTPLHITGVVMTRFRWCQIALYLNILADTLFHLQISMRLHQIRSNKAPNNSGDSSFVRENICYFRDIYSHCWAVVKLMSDYFGWSLIALLVKTTLESINGTYWYYVNRNTFASTQLNFHVLTYNSSVLILFWYLCSASQKCQNMGKSVAKALHTPSNYSDKDYQRFVRIFSLQLKEQPIKITMKQLFTFNHSLLKSTIILISTYAAIVIQFENAK